MADVALGLIMTARPVLWLVLPLVLRYVGLRRAGWVVLGFVAGLLPFWPPASIRFGAGVSNAAVALAMTLLSLAGAIWLPRERVMLVIGLLLLLPPFLVSCNALHALIAVPFLLAARCEHGR